MKLFYHEFGPIRNFDIRDYIGIYLRKYKKATFGFYITEDHSNHNLGWFNYRMYFCCFWWTLIILVVRHGNLKKAIQENPS